MTRLKIIYATLLTLTGWGLVSCESDMDISIERGAIRISLENVAPGVLTRSTPSDLGTPLAEGFLVSVRDGSGRDSPGAITRYLEVGHRIRKPKKAGAKGYRPRIRVAAVAGRFFYKSADAQKEGIINAELKKLEKELAENLDLEGKN